MNIFAVLYEINLPNLHHKTRNNEKMSMNVETRRSIKPKFRGLGENTQEYYTSKYISVSNLHL